MAVFFAINNIFKLQNKATMIKLQKAVRVELRGDILQG